MLPRTTNRGAPHRYGPPGAPHAPEALRGPRGFFAAPPHPAPLPHARHEARPRSALPARGDLPHAKTVQAGRVVEVELELEDDRLVWEVDLVSVDGLHEIELEGPDEEDDDGEDD